MQAQNFMRVEEVAQELGISKSHAYNRNFFMEKFCYGKTGKEG